MIASTMHHPRPLIQILLSHRPDGSDAVTKTVPSFGRGLFDLSASLDDPTDASMSPIARSLISASWLIASAAVVGSAAVVSSASGADHCLKRGDAVGVFYVTKVAGAVDDGVVPGEQLCYRCRYGSRPMVMVFARRTGGRLTELVRRLDRAVASNRRSSLKGMVTFVGGDATELKQRAATVAEEAAVKKVPVVVARETETGPTNYKLPADAAVTVVVAKDSQVVKTHTYDEDNINVS